MSAVEMTDSDVPRILAQLEQSGIRRKKTLQRLKQDLIQLQPQLSEVRAIQYIQQSLQLTPFQMHQLQNSVKPMLRLGQYELVRRIGKGGMGDVFFARHLQLNREVALKVITKSASRIPDAVERFQREMRIGATLANPHLVEIYDANTSNSWNYLAMEFVEGLDLKKVLQRHGPLPFPLALEILRQTAYGLEFIHSKGIIHRDISPQNLMIDTQGTVRLLDLGLAKAERALDDQSFQTVHSMVMGNIDFVSPEQAKSITNATSQSDLYSLGMVLWYLLSGNAPYPERTAVQKVLAHQNEPAPALEEVVHHPSQQMVAIYARLTAKKCGDRYQSATELLEDLKTIPELAPVPNLKHLSQLPSDVLETVEETSFSDQTIIDFDAEFSSGMTNAHTRKVSRFRDGSLLKLGLAVLIGACLGIFIQHYWLAAGPPEVAATFSRREAKINRPESVSAKVIPVSDGLLFNGRNNYVQTSYQHTSVEPFTVEAWVTCGSPSIPHNCEIISNAESAGFYLTITSDQQLRFSLSTKRKRYTDHWHDLKVPMNQKVHLAACYNGRELQTWINGQPSAKPTPVKYLPHPSAYPVMVGANPDPQLPGRKFESMRSVFYGVIHQVAMHKGATYSEPFTAETVLSVSPQTLLNYHFNEGAGDHVIDLSENHCDGQVLGATWHFPKNSGQKIQLEPLQGVRISNPGAIVKSAAQMNLSHQSYTMEFWVTPEMVEDTSRQFACLMEYRDVQLIRNLKSSTWELRTQASGPLPACRWISDSQIQTDRLMHVALQVHGNREPQLFVDGNSVELWFESEQPLESLSEPLEETTVTKENLIGTLWDGSSLSQLCLGARNDTTPHCQFTGMLHQFRISSYARYHGKFTPGRFWLIDNFCKALYTFDRKSGNELIDESINRVAGIVIDGEWVGESD